MRCVPGLIATTAIALAVTGCAGAGSSSAGGPPPPTGSAGSPSSAAAQPSSAAGEPSSAVGSPSAPPCTTHSCIAQDAEQSMVGTAAKDGSVVTKADCYRSTVTANAGDTYTVSCDITYTDGTVWNGLVTLLMASNQVSWQPESEVS
jgi:hypothetical protein